ncbi:MAG: AAA family ATPase [Ktedonobacteraceae bacterium]
MLIAMAGLPGTGKSTLAQRMANELPAVILNKDTIRAALFPPELVEYSTGQDDFCMSILFQVASYILRKDPGRHVIVDGRTFSRRYQVLALQDLATQLKTELKIIECVCSDATARQRLAVATDAEAQHPADNRNYALYLSIKARFEPIELPRLVVNTDNDLAQCLSTSIAYIREEMVE